MQGDGNRAVPFVCQRNLSRQPWTRLSACTVEAHCAPCMLQESRFSQIALMWAVERPERWATRRTLGARVIRGGKGETDGIADCV